MKTDEIIKKKGVQALHEKLDLVELERFISIMNREKFDYTKWRDNLFENLSLEELANRANEYSKSLKK